MAAALFAIRHLRISVPAPVFRMTMRIPCLPQMPPKRCRVYHLMTRVSSVQPEWSAEHPRICHRNWHVDIVRM